MAEIQQFVQEMLREQHDATFIDLSDHDVESLT
jgi:hypothetical protein